MEYSAIIGKVEKQQVACIVCAIYDDKQLPPTIKLLDEQSNGYISKLLKSGDINGNLGQSLILHNVPNLLCKRILVIGCGKKEKFQAQNFKQVCNAAITSLINSNITAACISLEQDLLFAEKTPSWSIQQIMISFANKLYRFNKYKNKTDLSKIALKKISFLADTKKQAIIIETAIKKSSAIIAGMNFAKDLANTPANICHPSYLASQAKTLAKDFKKITVTVLNEKDLQRLKMGALLAVSAGSVQEAKLITLEYHGAKTTNKPIVLVGKGITFDTGGNSLKPPAGMIGMKYDMCGAASVLGTILAAAKLDLPINIVGVIAAAENMPGGSAARPDDIVTSMAGITIEILNTDAEGRLVLCDALTYSERFNPEYVIDIATLTGACVIALGRVHSGLFTNHQPLAEQLLAAGKKTEDLAWQLPINDDYQKLLDSNFADVANIGGPEAGTITAACFLARFAKNFNWAHLDVAGTACCFNGKEKSASGRPIPLLVQFLLEQCRLS
jgi:leucyl aminopeptidase